MRILIILGHPDPKSFNHAIASDVHAALRNDGHHVTLHDLYVEGFDPLLPVQEIPERGAIPSVIQEHCEDLRSADGIVIIHPNWWGQPPAILKGWIDRVFRPGVAYRFEEGDGGEGVPIGLLKAKAAVVLNTSNTPDEREQGVFGDPLDALWRRCIFDLCGVRTFHRRTFSVIVTSTPHQRRAWLEEAKGLCKSVFQKGPHDKSMDSDKEWQPHYDLDTRSLIRNEEEKDWAAVHALNVAAFETPAEANLVDALRQQARPVISLVAEEHQAVVGHIMFSPVKLSGHSELMIMGLAPMAVTPEHQRKGIGFCACARRLRTVQETRLRRRCCAGAPRILPTLRFLALRIFWHKLRIRRAGGGVHDYRAYNPDSWTGCPERSNTTQRSAVYNIRVSKEEVDMRLSTINVENMFERAKAMNLDTWKDGKKVLEDFKRLNELIQEPIYTDTIKKELLDTMKRRYLSKEPRWWRPFDRSQINT